MIFFARYCTFSKKAVPGGACRTVSPSGTSCTTYYQIGSAAGKNGEASLFDRILRELALSKRVICGREPKTAMIIIDAKSIKNTDTAEEKGYDAGKKLQG
jgi:hypothetical protein